jgi:hypothetical protein
MVDCDARSRASSRDVLIELTRYLHAMTLANAEAQ